MHHRRKSRTAPRPKGILIPRYATESRKEIWLTFDDGPHSSNTDAVLKVLGKFGIHATFFVVGQNVKKYPEIVRRIFQAGGHRIGNHSFTHRNLTQLTEQEIRDEIQNTQQLIEPYTNGKILRPPFGAHNAKVDRIASALGYRLVFWNVDTLDWDPKFKPRRWIEHGLEQIRKRDDCRVLNHDIHKTTADHLEEFIEKIIAIGSVVFKPPSTL